MRVPRNLLAPAPATVRRAPLHIPAGELVVHGDAVVARRRARAIARSVFEGAGWPVLLVGVNAWAATVAVAAAEQPGEHGLWGLPLAVLLGGLALRTHRTGPRSGLLDQVGPAVSAPVVGAILLAAAAGLGALTVDPRGLGGAVLFAAALGAFGRIAFVGLRRELRRRGHTAVPTLVVGSGAISRTIAERLRADPTFGLRPVALVGVDPDADGPVTPDRRCEPDDLPDLARALGAEHVVLAFSSRSDAYLAPALRRLQAERVGVSVVPRLFEALGERHRLERVGGLPVVELDPPHPKGVEFAAKHGLDRLIAAILLLVLAPVFAIAALLVRLESPGPVLFRQRRVGRDGREFDLLKLRSMRPLGAEEDAQPHRSYEVGPGGVEGPDRRTRVGRVLRRTSLDELPQLLNVARGEMSLVGPRPERPELAALFAERLDRYGDRHRVKSGITGWAQVHGLRGRTSLADRVEWDNWYIANWSLWLDVKILLLTVRAVLRGAE